MSESNPRNIKRSVQQPNSAATILQDVVDDLERQRRQYEMAVDDIAAMDDPDVHEDKLLRMAAKADAYQDLALQLQRRLDRLEDVTHDETQDYDG